MHVCILINIYLINSISCIRTQLPQAVGAAYSLKVDKKDACVVTFFGDGCSSEVYKFHIFCFIFHTAHLCTKIKKHYDNLYPFLYII